jgi:hypothetical protein
MKKQMAVVLVSAVMGTGVMAQGGPVDGEREFSLAGTGTSDKDFDNSSFGISGDIGWYTRDHIVWGVRQSVVFADVEGEGLSNDFWSGSTRGYMNWQFFDGAARPFVGANLGAVYGDGVNDSGTAGLEFGLKYYVLPKTYILARAEYQFFFDSGSDAADQFDDGAFNYVLGMGYNF